MRELTTWDEAVTCLQTALMHLDEMPETQQEVAALEAVLARYQPLFAREHIPELTGAEFYSFLLYENNQHWTGLNRHGPRITADMDRLRTALDLLLYGAEDITQRFTESVAMVTGMGRAVASALLLVAYPDRYGVWNSTSEAGLKRLRLWPDFDRRDLWRACLEFASRDRRFGGAIPNEELLAMEGRQES